MRELEALTAREEGFTAAFEKMEAQQRQLRELKEWLQHGQLRLNQSIVKKTESLESQAYLRREKREAGEQVQEQI